MKKIKLELTESEAKALNEAIGNSYGDGDWDDYLDSVGDAKQKKAFHRGWRKLLAALSTTEEARNES